MINITIRTHPHKRAGAAIVMRYARCVASLAWSLVCAIPALCIKNGRKARQRKGDKCFWGRFFFGYQFSRGALFNGIAMTIASYPEKNQR
jgi:hypothetical protein